jgi:hypothetical protein
MECGSSSEPHHHPSWGVGCDVPHLRGFWFRGRPAARAILSTKYLIQVGVCPARARNPPSVRAADGWKRARR